MCRSLIVETILLVDSFRRGADEGMFCLFIKLTFFSCCIPAKTCSSTLENTENQCCGYASGSASNKNPDPHPDTHRSDKLDPEPDAHQFADESQNVWNMSLFEHFFKILNLYKKLT
jgi:hypothetical protein